MKELHFNLYNDGYVGLCNVLMSVENALLIAKLTKRDKIVFYGTKRFYNSSSRIQDIYDIDFTVEFRDEDIIKEEDIVIFNCNFHDTVFYHKNYPTKNFINERSNIVNLEDYEKYDKIGTLDNKTLGFYSYLFYIVEERLPLYYWLKSVLNVKTTYRYLSLEVYNQLCSTQENYSSYNSVHVRRGDYLLTSDKNKDVKIEDCISKIQSVCKDTNKMLLVHTDELDEDYFKSLTNIYTNVVFVDQYIRSNYVNLNNTEVGIVSLLVASYSDYFIGTMKSTFTSYIQRYRLYNQRSEEFCFLYSQDERIVLDSKGRFYKEPFSEYTWNNQPVKESLRNICFWFREWNSCFPQPYAKSTELRVCPNFLTNEESNYIIGKCNENRNSEPFYTRENRNRVILSCNSDEIVKNIFIRSCLHLGYQTSEEEIKQSYLQVFLQYAEGETFWHMDSLAPNNEEDSIRKRSILFYLNDNFSGSEISFPYLGVTFKPKKNTMITYPLINEFGEMNRLTSHSASLLTNGNKYMCYFDTKYV